MNLKKIANVKNITCFAVVLALGIGILIAERKNGDLPDADKKAKLNGSSSSAAAESQGDGNDREKVVLAAEIPEYSCSAVVFDDSVVFADQKGSYSFIANGTNTKGITVMDDSGAEIDFSVDDGNLVLIRDDQPATGFIYEKHLIELKDGKLFFDSSPVEYKSTSFSSYRLSDEYVVECTAKGQYRLKNSKGEIKKECVITESTGASIKIKADDKGFYTEGENDGLFYNVYKIRDDILLTSWGYVLYINGEELVPYGYTDKYSDPDIKVDIDKVALEPTDPPVDRGFVCTDDDGVSELTTEMLGYVNEVRTQHDMEPVYGLAKLDSASAVRAEELAAEFSHVRPDEKKSEYSTALGKEGLSWWRCGENIAKGGTSCKEVFDSWISSKEHRAVILDPDMKYLSVASFEDGGETYWDMLMFNDTYMPTGDEADE